MSLAILVRLWPRLNITRTQLAVITSSRTPEFRPGICENTLTGRYVSGQVDRYQRIQNICRKVGHQNLGVVGVLVFGQHSSQSLGIIHVFRDLDFLHFITEKKMKEVIHFIQHSFLYSSQYNACQNVLKLIKSPLDLEHRVKISSSVPPFLSREVLEK